MRLRSKAIILSCTIAVVCSAAQTAHAGPPGCKNTGEDCSAPGSVCCETTDTCGPGPGGGGGPNICSGLNSSSNSSGRTLMVDIGTRFDFLTILYRIINFLAITIGTLSVAIFIAGALVFTASRGKDDMVQWGKDLMTGSLFGLVTALASYAMLRTIYYFLYVV